MHQTCKTCGRKQRFEFSVTDELWTRSGGTPGAMCVECWLELAELNGLEKIEISEIRFLGIVGDRLNLIILDTHT